MSNPAVNIQDERFPDTHRGVYSKTIFGFWVYLLSDFMLFATLFAAYAVLRNATYGGPTAKDLFNIHYTLIQTVVLLCASLTAGMGGVFAHKRRKIPTIICFTLTFIVGLVFMAMEWGEFTHLIASGSGWQRSAFLSSYFTVVGTHGLHVIFALLWVIVLLPPVFKDGLNPVNIRRLTCLRMFWQFLNVVWIFIFTIIYLMGVY
ncbi:uncharacterized protein TRIADDRAFT_35138 [Trichoplax adhaerens]|uniref:Cytochrome c oxidase subunit 3 n=1 Tax=Trichoplax adhaerens TaxID=10228 RepID=B3SFS3_TRIAD|nr:hypothetical protein TRIADDRAFT_35138 [Trichoplax adhaerens]EDV18422.1 hypothetical protein TRIADDRAFT_35138 [Trichoplax adhaerens]|eukprot:XP_002119092.1 hypothetical protein TRIADDRAFT_35138 [Trichoplax adhaerens]